MMITVALPSNIPMLWEPIKYAAIHADNIRGDHSQAYLNKLLHNLLSGKAQCIVSYNEKRELLAIVILEIYIDKFTQEKELFSKVTYGFEHSTDDEWVEVGNAMIAMARKEGCARIIAQSQNSRVFELAKLADALLDINVRTTEFYSVEV